MAGKEEGKRPELKEMSALIRNARLDAGLKQQEAAERVGVNMVTWSRLENARTLPHINTLGKIAEVLGLNFNRLLATIANVGDQDSRQNDGEERINEGMFLPSVQTGLYLDREVPRGKSKPDLLNQTHNQMSAVLQASDLLRRTLARCRSDLSDSSTIPQRFPGCALSTHTCTALVARLEDSQEEFLLNIQMALEDYENTTSMRNGNLTGFIAKWYAKLSDEERQVLTALWAYPTGASRDDIITIDDKLGVDLGLALEKFQEDRFVRSVQPDYDSGQTQVRYRMVESLHDYISQVVATSQKDAVREKQIALYTALSERARQDTEYVDRLERDFGNVQEIMKWCLSTHIPPEKGLHFAYAMRIFWHAKGRMEDGIKFIADLLVRIETGKVTVDRVRVLNVQGGLHGRLGRYSEARSCFSDALEAAEVLVSEGGAPPTEIAKCLNNLGMVCMEEGDYEAARNYYQRAEQIDREHGTEEDQATDMNQLGNAFRGLKMYSEALRYHATSLELYQNCGDEAGQAYANGALALDYYSRGHAGDWDRATEHYIRSLETFWRYNELVHILECIEGLARTASSKDKLECAARLFGGAKRLRTDHSLPLALDEERVYNQERRTLRERLGAQAFDRETQIGAEMTREELVSYALSND